MSTILEPKGSDLKFEVFAGQLRAMASNATLISSGNEAVLIDTLLVKEDAEQLVKNIRATGKELTSILITHAHPDHYFGLPVIQAAFPKAQVYARPITVEFLKEFSAKIIHWQEMYPGEIPAALALPKLLQGNTFELNGQQIQIVDLEMVETTVATAFYVPSAKTLVSADLIYSKSHHYMSDVGRADTWIEEIQQVRRAYDIEHVIPGHGPVGSSRLFEESLDWLDSYLKIAKPGMRFNEIADALVKKYPKHGLSLLLYVTRGPGFGLAGAEAVGAPPEFYAPGE
jgi:glyoxylase-like metal-dependent hydrolase (beta-lactamase superfamily II)